jgi:hypothetical protein
LSVDGLTPFDVFLISRELTPFYAVANQSVRELNPFAYFLVSERQISASEPSTRSRLLFSLRTRNSSTFSTETCPTLVLISVEMT